jgi:hypothetical protein
MTAAGIADKALIEGLDRRREQDILALKHLGSRSCGSRAWAVDRPGFISRFQ